MRYARTPSLARAQCPVDRIIVKGRIGHRTSKNNDDRVRVQLLDPTHKPGESGEVTVEDADFQIPVEFVTGQSSLFTNLPKRCGRKPQTVVVTLLSGNQKSDEVSLDFTRDFRIVDASGYRLRSELVRNGFPTNSSAVSTTSRRWIPHLQTIESVGSAVQSRRATSRSSNEENE